MPASEIFDVIRNRFLLPQSAFSLACGDRRCQPGRRGCKGPGKIREGKGQLGLGEGRMRRRGRQEKGGREGKSLFRASRPIFRLQNNTTLTHLAPTIYHAAGLKQSSHTNQSMLFHHSAEEFSPWNANSSLSTSFNASENSGSDMSANSGNGIVVAVLLASGQLLSACPLAMIEVRGGDGCCCCCCCCMVAAFGAAGKGWYRPTMARRCCA